MQLQRNEKERGVFLCRRTMRVEVESKAIPTSFLKIEKECTHWNERMKKDSKKNKEVVRTQVLKLLSRSGEGKKGPVSIDC